MALTKVQIGMTDAPTSGTAVTASGTSVDFNSIPATVKRITVMFSGVSTSGANNYLIQLGSGTIQSTGYISTYIYVNGTSAATSSSTAGFMPAVPSAAAAATGAVSISLVTGANWVCQGTLSMLTNAATSFAGGVTLAGVLDRIRITTVTGTDTFDAGTINIMYE